MNNNTLASALAFLLLIPAQALVFNNLILFNAAVPLAFIYLIITLPVTYSANAAMTIGFLAGLCVDILSDTPGVNALAATVLAFVRRPVFHLYMAADNDLAEQRPSPRNMGVPAFLKYAGTMVFLYCLTYFTIEALGHFDLSLFLLRVSASSVYTLIMLYGLTFITVHRHEKRL